MAKQSMLERLTSKYSPKKKPTSKAPTQSPEDSTSENHLDLEPSSPHNTRPKLNKFAHEFDRKGLQDGVIGSDFVQGLNIIDEDGGLDLKALNQAFQKVAFYSIQQANNSSLEAISGFEDHNQQTLDTFIKNNNDDRSVTGKVFSEKASLQESALMKRAQLRANFPDATPEEINEATEEWVQSNLEDLGLDEESLKASKDSDDFQDVTAELDTDWEKELGLPPLADVTSREEGDVVAGEEDLT